MWVPAIWAHGVNECGRARIRLVISLTWMPLATNASAINDR